MGEMDVVITSYDLFRRDLALLRPVPLYMLILDEAQNATGSQLKMFLTRMGRNAKFVITGDLTQIDLPRHQQSGLLQAVNILKDVKGIEVIELDNSDVIRHRLVTDIIKAYEDLGYTRSE